jgi:hypothetical protein
MANDNRQKRLPPYVSYRTFHNFLEGMRQQMPSRIDRSYWSGTLSGSTGTQLMAALRFLELIDTSSRPAAQLKALVSTEGEKREPVLKEIANRAYGFVFKGALDPQNATYAQLEEVFHEAFKCTGEVARKCIKFFIALSGDAGVPLSPFITKRIKPLYTHSVSGNGKQKKKNSIVNNRNYQIPNTSKEIPDTNSWNEMLLTKFPSFDPAWNDEVKLKWFSAFDELLRRNL